MNENERYMPVQILELDFLVDGEQTIPNVLQEVSTWLQAEQFPATELWIRVTKLVGPAGGWPVVEIGHIDRSVLDEIKERHEG